MIGLVALFAGMVTFGYQRLRMAAARAPRPAGSRQVTDRDRVTTVALEARPRDHGAAPEAGGPGGSGRGCGLDEATAVAALQLLAHWWSRPVAEEVTTWSGAAEIEAEVRSRMPEGKVDLLLSSGGGDRTGLLDEHERLFVGPGPVPCPPYESFWREDVPIDIRRSLMGAVHSRTAPALCGARPGDGTSPRRDA